VDILSKIHIKAAILGLKLVELAQPSAYQSAFFKNFLVFSYLEIGSLYVDGI
jgi:hypothetical protein